MILKIFKYSHIFIYFCQYQYRNIFHLDLTLASMHNTEKSARQHKDLKTCLFGQTNLMYFLGEIFIIYLK